MGEYKRELGFAISLYFSSLICSVGTILGISNKITDALQDPRTILVLGLIFLSGVAALLGGMLFGRSLVIRTNPTLGIKVLIYIFIPVMSVLTFCGATYFMMNF